MMHSPPKRTVLLAGGGSGGHLAPGLAIAERLAESTDDDAGAVRSVFACSHRAIDASMLSQAGATFIPTAAQPLSLHPLRAVRWLSGFRTAEAEVRSIIREHRVDAVLALGGFVSAPAARAAHRAGLPVILLNLDAVPGRANRLVRRWCSRVLTAVELHEPAPFTAEVVGMPVRRAAIAPEDAAACRRKLGLDPQRKVLFVTGASQGARSVNALLPALARKSREAFDGWQVLHLSGSGEADAVRSAWERTGVLVVVHEFLHEIGLAWGSATLAVSRAGASSVAEAAINAVPALFLPYPWHRDQHQRRNAQPLVACGGAVIVEDRVEADQTIAESGAVMTQLLTSPDRIEAMREALTRHHPGDAAAGIARIVRGTLRTAKTADPR